MPATVSIEKKRALEYLLQGDALKDDQKAELLASEGLRAQTLAALEQIELSRANAADGSVHIRAGSRHVNLRKLLESAAISVFFLGLSTLDPTKFSLLAGAEKGVEFLHTLSGLLNRMDDTQIYIYDIVAEFEKQNAIPSINPAHKQGTEEDILAGVYKIPGDLHGGL